MADTKTIVTSFLARLGWDLELEASKKRVEDVLKNKKLCATVVYLYNEVCVVLW